MTGYEVTIKEKEHTKDITKIARGENAMAIKKGSFLFKHAEEALWFYFKVRESLTFIKIDPVNIEVEKEDTIAA
jgi:hypothetical protein